MASEPQTEREELAVHARNYHQFMLVLKWFVLHLVVLGSFLVVSFATPAGIGWGLFVAIVAAVVGVYAMTHGLAHSSDAETLRRS